MLLGSRGVHIFSAFGFRLSIIILMSQRGPSGCLGDFMASFFQADLGTATITFEGSNRRDLPGDLERCPRIREVESSDLCGGTFCERLSWNISPCNHGIGFSLKKGASPRGSERWKIFKREMESSFCWKSRELWDTVRFGWNFEEWCESFRCGLGFEDYRLRYRLKGGSKAECKSRWFDQVFGTSGLNQNKKTAVKWSWYYPRGLG